MTEWISAEQVTQWRLPRPFTFQHSTLFTSGARLRQFGTLVSFRIQDPLRTHSTIKMTLQFKRKYSTQGSGDPCHVSFGFFSEFYGIRFAELHIDPQLESTIRPKARGLHSIWNAILQITFSIWFFRQDNTSTIEDHREENSRMLGDYSRRLQDYSRISWSTFQHRDASSTLEDFWLVVLGDAWKLLVKAIKSTRNYPTRLQSTRGFVVWTSLGPLFWWVPGPTTRWAPGTTRLVLHGTCWHGAQGLQRNSTRIGRCTCPDPCKVLLAVHD
jgi:hypothetical protein